uniref:Uncharacterized protein n=1 Tax=Oryza punctata TaxID=4537 RepID=A0A0E0KB17_ORYPU
MRQRDSADLLQSEKRNFSRNNKVIFSENSHPQEVLAPRMLALHQLLEVKLKTIVTRHAPCDAEVNLNRLAKAMGFRSKKERIANLACLAHGREVSSLSVKKEFRHFSILMVHCFDINLCNVVQMDKERKDKCIICRA